MLPGPLQTSGGIVASAHFLGYPRFVRVETRVRRCSMKGAAVEIYSYRIGVLVPVLDDDGRECARAETRE